MQCVPGLGQIWPHCLRFATLPRVTEVTPARKLRDPKLCYAGATLALRKWDVHEITVALGLLDGVEMTAREQGIDRVEVVHVRIGALSGVVRDALLFSWDVATADSIAAGSRLAIEEIPLVVFCEFCEAERAPQPGYGLLCPDCGTPSPRIVRGREMQLVAMEVPA